MPWRENGKSADMQADQIEIEKEKLIFCEGKDDKAVFESIARKFHLNDWQVMEYGGKDSLEKGIKTILNLSDFHKVTNLVITRDADESVNSAFQSVCAVLGKFSLPVPSSNGSHVSNERITVGVRVIHAEGKSVGSLEDLVLDSISPNIFLSMAERFVGAIFLYRHILNDERAVLMFSKIKIRIWLLGVLSKNDITKNLGAAADKDVFQWTGKSATEFVEFLRSAS